MYIMERPNWAFINKTFFNEFNASEHKIFIFSDFEHNWDLLQFLTNNNKYYFCLNKNIYSTYNFQIVYNTYCQKCKHINKENICFLLLDEFQEQLFKDICVEMNYLFKDDFLKMFNLDESITAHFATYSIYDALQTINNTNQLSICETVLKNEIEKNTIKRASYDTYENGDIVCFGASVTQQQYSYVNYLKNNLSDINVIKRGFSGCQINQAIWLTDEFTDDSLKTPAICMLDWTTPVFKPTRDELIVYLNIIVEKLLKNNMTPIFLYLFKSNINDYLDIVNIHEEVAEHFGISSIHMYKIIQNIQIDVSLILKDTCHTNYDGSNLYGSIIKTCLIEYLFNRNIPCAKANKTRLTINRPIYEIHKGTKAYPISSFVDCSNLEKTNFNGKDFYRIDSSLSIDIPYDQKTLMAIHILYCKNNGFIYVNGCKIQTWDTNCYYTRSGYMDFVNLNIPVNNNIFIEVSQEIFKTFMCKYEIHFPEEKYMWISELIFN